VSALSNALRQSLGEPETRARFAASGLDPLPGSPEEFAALIRKEIAKWAKVIRTAGIKAE
jgi:tripartite-type tricarboxylate transporter receptor subunit TctC